MKNSKIILIDPYRKKALTRKWNRSAHLILNTIDGGADHPDRDIVLNCDQGRHLLLKDNTRTNGRGYSFVSDPDTVFYGMGMIVNLIGNGRYGDVALTPKQVEAELNWVD